MTPIGENAAGAGGETEYRVPEGGAPWLTRRPVRLVATTVALAAGWLSLALPSCRWVPQSLLVRGNLLRLLLTIERHPGHDALEHDHEHQATVAASSRTLLPVMQVRKMFTLIMQTIKSAFPTYMQEQWAAAAGGIAGRVPQRWQQR